MIRSAAAAGAFLLALAAAGLLSRVIHSTLLLAVATLACLLAAFFIAVELHEGGRAP